MNFSHVWLLSFIYTRLLWAGRPSVWIWNIIIEIHLLFQSKVIGYILLVTVPAKYKKASRFIRDKMYLKQTRGQFHVSIVCTFHFAEKLVCKVKSAKWSGFHVLKAWILQIKLTLQHFLKSLINSAAAAMSSPLIGEFFKEFSLWKIVPYQIAKIAHLKSFCA